jgi:beta-mannanase
MRGHRHHSGHRGPRPGSGPPAYSKVKLAAHVGEPSGGAQTAQQVEAFHALIAPRRLDRLMVFVNFATKPALQTFMKNLSAETGVEEMVIAWQPDPAGGTFNAQIMGGAYTAYFEEQLAAIKAWGKPIVFRICHEFNGSWQTTWGAWHETAAEFIEAWKKLYELIHAKGGPNVYVAWNPNIWGGASTKDPVTYFPGEAYVDIVGLDGYMQGGALLQQPAALFKAPYETVHALAPTRPFYIFETGCCPSGEDKNGVLDKAAWFTNLAHLVNHEISVSGLGYWHRHKEGESDNTIDSSGTDVPARTAFKAMVNNPVFV